jgi:aldose 1-epimerase
MSSPIHPVTVSVTRFGELPDGRLASLFHLTSPELRVTVTDFGARVISLLTRDRRGTWADVSLGYGSVEPYATPRNGYFGATIGRFANRIAGGRFWLDGREYQVPANNGANALHGGPHSFDQRLWQSRMTPDGVDFELLSPDGDNGFPGSVRVTASFALQANRLQLRYRADASAPTVLNLTNHTYFNLAGEGAETILDHELLLYADQFTPINSLMIPTGEVLPVNGTPFDFTRARSIGSRIGEPSAQLAHAGGYDHNLVIRTGQAALRPAARVYCPATGRTLEIETSEPGVQFYSGNFLNGSHLGRSGKPYVYRAGLCLETQHFPDSPNHKAFPATTLLPGDEFRSETTWRFTAG